MAMHKMTERNLNEAYAGESMAYMKYNIWADKAEQEGKPQVARLFRAISQAEKVHAQMYSKAKGAVESGKDAQFAEIWVCPVCGYTGEGPAPDLCPICDAKKSSFKKF